MEDCYNSSQFEKWKVESGKWKVVLKLIAFYLAESRYYKKIYEWVSFK